MNAVTLRKFKLSDLNRLYKLFADDNVLKLLDLDGRSAKDIPLKEERDFILKAQKRYKQKNPDGLNLAILVNDELAGSITSHHIDYLAKKTKVGYWLGKEYWGKGIMVKAIKIFCKFLNEKYEIQRFAAAPLVKNKKSHRVLEKAGFKLEGISRKSMKVGNKILDQKVYAKIVS